MFLESKVTEIYCIADDFCKEFALQQEKFLIIEDKERVHCNNPNHMNGTIMLSIPLWWFTPLQTLLQEVV